MIEEKKATHMERYFKHQYHIYHPEYSYNERLNSIRGIKDKL